MSEFSSRGEPATVFEQQLLAQTVITAPESVRDIWILIGQKIGATALAVVLDELGAEKVHVPTRADFFEMLYRPIRNQRVRELRASGMSWEGIAAAVCISTRMVQYILYGDGRRDDTDASL